MLDFLVSLLTGLAGFLNSVLPNSPFTGFVQAGQSLQLGLGWLNWFFPVGDCLLLFGAYLALLLVWASVDFALSKAGKSVLGMIGK